MQFVARDHVVVQRLSCGSDPSFRNPILRGILVGEPPGQGLSFRGDPWPARSGASIDSRPLDSVDSPITERFGIDDNAATRCHLA